MVYIIFVKKSAGTSTHKGTGNNFEKQQLAEELHTSIIRKFQKLEVYSTFKDNAWGADLTDKQLIST